jgi:hypothetical protein
MICMTSFLLVFCLNQMVNKVKSRSYTLLVKDELIFLASHIFQAQIQILCYSIEELITKIV